ncbi:hypothetical protein [Christiangramia sp.]|uniref:hypothetical protein n=1 Tax=Christiangramia sp. TaxID=1931228 RepID=UPI0026064A28|nr:hypothetical protein [Christiangramia sp.]
MEQQLELEVKTATVRKAALEAFRQMPVKFNSLTYCLTVRNILNKMTMDGTILRRLREQLEDEVINYRTINSNKGIYEKLKT